MTQNMVSILEERDSYEYQVTFCPLQKQTGFELYPKETKRNGVSTPSQGSTNTSSLLIVKTQLKIKIKKKTIIFFLHIIIRRLFFIKEKKTCSDTKNKVLQCYGTHVYREQKKSKRYSRSPRKSIRLNHKQRILTKLMQWLSAKESAWQYRRHQRRRFDTCVGKTHWSRKWQPTLVFLPGKLQTEEPGRLQSIETQQQSVMD